MDLQRTSRIEATTIVVLSLTEVGLGSVIHAFSIPFGGHFLSLNQGLLLTQAVKQSQATRVSSAKTCNSISLVSGLLKSLSPAGKKLTPMLAITVQGFLYSLGILFLGANVAGMILGSLLLNLWGFIQPLLLAWLFVGDSFLTIFHKEWVFSLLLVSLVCKSILAILTVIFSETLSHKLDSKLIAQGEAHFSKKKLEVAPLRGALRDLMSPLFLFSLAISVGYVYFNNPQSAALFWAVLRPLALGFIVFYIIRILPIEKVRKNLEKLSPSLAEKIARAQEALHKLEK